MTAPPAAGTRFVPIFKIEAAQCAAAVAGRRLESLDSRLQLPSNDAILKACSDDDQR